MNKSRDSNDLFHISCHTNYVKIRDGSNDHVVPLNNIVMGTMW